jgi:hypothetical protein
MSIVLNGTTGITTPDITSTAGIDSADLTGDIAASQITNALNATGDAPIYACRAWVNFNGSGTVAIRASGNVSSITDNGVGTYTVNFTTAMPNANYSVQGTCSSNRFYNNDGIGFVINIAMNLTTPVQYNTSGVRISTGLGNGAPVDTSADYMQVAIFSN